MERRTFLKALTIAASTPAAIGAITYDPLLEAINTYRSGKAALEAMPSHSFTIENDDAVVKATFGAPQRLLLDWDGPALSREGAVEALKLMGQEVFGGQFLHSGSRP